LAQRPYPFHPPISLITFDPQAAFPPEDGNAQHLGGEMTGGKGKEAKSGKETMRRAHPP